MSRADPNIAHVQNRKLSLKSGHIKAVLAAAYVLAVLFALVVSKWAFGHATAINADVPEVAALGASFAPNDPHARLKLASLLEKTFVPEDRARALDELEAAVALSPQNYVYWLALGRAREQSGDPKGAEAALRKAHELAPNYARVQWALGNNLLRQGRDREAFELIRSSAATDSSFAAPAAATAWQVFAGDLERIRENVGDSSRINAALAVLLASDKRFSEASDFWARVPADEKRNGLKESGTSLYMKFIDAGLYSRAVAVGHEAGLFDGGGPAVGSVTNGTFESALTSREENTFAWMIDPGPQPSIGLNGSQKKSGNYSLLINFGRDSKTFRRVSQKIAAEPGANYELKFFYRSELETRSKFFVEIVTPGDGDVIASSPLSIQNEWAENRMSFAVPSQSEGVEVRITAEACAGGACSFSGNIWFDDFSLTKL